MSSHLYTITVLTAQLLFISGIQLASAFKDILQDGFGRPPEAPCRLTTAVFVLFYPQLLSPSPLSVFISLFPSRSCHTLEETKQTSAAPLDSPLLSVCAAGGHECAAGTVLWIRQRDVLSGAGTTAFKHTNKSDLGLKDGLVGDIFFFFFVLTCVFVYNVL